MNAIADVLAGGQELQSAAGSGAGSSVGVRQRIHLGSPAAPVANALISTASKA
jgi:hypothetical protein